MTQELQALLDRINQDGVTKAQAERERIVGEAEAEAKKIIAAARSEAERLVGKAEEDANLLVRKGEESLRQAARDILLSLREQLQSRLAAVVKACLVAETDGKGFARVIVDTVGGQLKDNTISELEVMVSEKDQEVVASHIFSALGKDLQKNVVITPLSDQEGGFRLRFDQADVIYDFSDSALTDTLTAFLGPRLIEILDSDREKSDQQDNKNQGDNSKKRAGAKQNRKK